LLVSNSSEFVLFNIEVFYQLLVQKPTENGARLPSSTSVSNVVKCDKGLAVHSQKLQDDETEVTKAGIIVFGDGPHTLAHGIFEI
jgi:hypothetical protein